MRRVRSTVAEGNQLRGHKPGVDEVPFPGRRPCPSGACRGRKGCRARAWTFKLQRLCLSLLAAVPVTLACAASLAEAACPPVAVVEGPPEIKEPIAALLRAHGIGSDIQRPLATVVVGGLCSTLMLTLLALPAVYWLAETVRGRTSPTEVTST